MVDSLGLEPGAGVSEFVGNHSYAVEIGVILVDLVVRISPAITDSNTFKNDFGLVQKGFVVDDSLSEGRDIVSCEGLSCNIEWTLLQSWPLFVEVGKEVEQMITCFAG